MTQRNIEEAARAAGIGTRTLIRWLKLPEFLKEYRKARREAVQQSVARMQQAPGATASVVLKLMTDPNVPAPSSFGQPSASLITPSRESIWKISRHASSSWSELRRHRGAGDKTMSRGNLARRLKRLEAEFVSASKTLATSAGVHELQVRR